MESPVLNLSPIKVADAVSTATVSAVHAVVPKAVKGRRPQPNRVNLNQQLGTRHLLEIVNIESNACITKVAVDGETIVVGTSTGRIIGYDKATFSGKIECYNEHRGEKVLDIWVRDKRAIVSLSKKVIYLKRFPGQDSSSGIEEGIVKVNLSDMLSLTVIENQLSKSMLFLAVGTESGRLVIYDAGSSGLTDMVSKDRQKEGSVFKVIHQHGLLIWVNRLKIYVKHYTRSADQNIIYIERPEVDPALPSHFYGSTNSMPFFDLKIVQKQGVFTQTVAKFPTIKMYSCWFNLVIKNQFEYDSRERKYKYL